MIQKLKTLIKKYPVEGLILLFCLVVYFLDSVNGRLWMNDFKVYYSAAEDLLRGKDFYGKVYALNSGNFKYSPVAALLFIPFSIFPYDLAKSLFFILSSFAIATFFLQIRILLSKTYLSSDKKINKILLICFIASATHLFRELHLGNLNMILLSLLLLSINLMNKKESHAGILLAICLLIKPHFLIFLPLLLIRKKFKALLFQGTAFVFGILIPAFILGWEQNLISLTQWMETIRNHQGGIEQAKQTLAYILLNLFGIGSSVGNFTKVSILLTSIFALGVLFLVVRHVKSESKNQQNLFVVNFQREYFLLLAMIPSLTVTDTEHFLFSLPLISVLLLTSFVQERRRRSILLILALLMYGANWHDLVGEEISTWMFRNGVLGIGNVLLLVIYFLEESTPGMFAAINKAKEATHTF